MTNGPVKNRSRPIYTNCVGTESLMKMKIIKVHKHQGFHGLGYTLHLMYQYYELKVTQKCIGKDLFLVEICRAQLFQYCSFAR